MKDDSVEIVFQSFFAGGPCEQFWHGQRYPLFGVVHPAFSLPTTMLSILRGALKNGSEEAIVACDVPEPCMCPSLDSCENRFLPVDPHGS